MRVLRDGDVAETWGVMLAPDRAFAISPRRSDTMYQVAPTASIVPHAVSGTPGRLQGRWRGDGLTEVSMKSGPNPYPDLPPKVSQGATAEFSKDEILATLATLGEHRDQWTVTSTGGGFRPDGSYGAEAEVIRVHEDLATWSATLPVGLLVVRPYIRQQALDRR